MASFTQFVICLGLILKFTLAAEEANTPFDDVFEDVTSCSSSCERTYPLHTYPKVFKSCFVSVKTLDLDFIV